MNHQSFPLSCNKSPTCEPRQDPQSAISYKEKVLSVIAMIGAQV